MNIKVVKENSLASHSTGGAYAVNDLTIYLDEKLPLPDQRECAIHEYLENKFPSWPHEKYDEVADEILEILDQIEGDAGIPATKNWFMWPPGKGKLEVKDGDR